VVGGRVQLELHEAGEEQQRLTIALMVMGWCLVVMWPNIDAVTVTQ
jgi:hypothetical protein